MKTKFCAISGVARSGKGTLSNLLFDFFLKRDFVVSQQSLATPLKMDCNDFLEDNFGISAFTQNTEEKTFIRNYLIAVGEMRRKRSKGTYYTSRLIRDVVFFLNPEPDFVIVDDLRYADLEKYPDDELAFFQKQNSYIIHVKRLSENGTLVPPANDHEAVNNPIIERWSHAQLVWNTSGGIITEDMKNLAEDLGNRILRFYGL